MPALAGAVALCLLAVLAPTGSALRTRTAAASAPGLLGGLNIASPVYGIKPTVLRHTLAWARTLHAKVVRVEIPWSVMEPHGAGQIDPQALANTDALMTAAEKAGIKVIMFVEVTPCWSSTAPAALLAKCTENSWTEANAYPPRHDGDYGAFMAFLAQRYGAGLAALEVWNEPDQINQHYLAGPEKPQAYAGLLRAAYPAIKQVDPILPVLGGSLVGSNGAFLKALYQAGIKGYYDGLSVHFYHLTLASLRSIHEVQAENGDTAPLWLNEFGFSSCWPHFKVQQEQACVTSRLQAFDLSSIVRSLAHMPYVASAVVYKLQNSSAEEFGLLSTSGAHKPSFGALASAFASPFTSPGHVSVALRQSGSAVVASGTAPPGDFMHLEVLEGGTERYHALFTLNRFNSYSIPLPRQLGTRGLTVSVYQYTLGAGQAAQATI